MLILVIVIIQLVQYTWDNMAYTYINLVKPFKDASLAYPNVRQFLASDIYKLNDKEKNKYVSIVMSLESTLVEEDVMHYNVVLFYVDRLTEGGDNELEIVSVGTETIHNIITKVKNGQDVFTIPDGYTITPFRERFADECSGTFCRFTIDLPISICDQY